jgi:hypothetical protein
MDNELTVLAKKLIARQESEFLAMDAEERGRFTSGLRDRLRELECLEPPKYIYRYTSIVSMLDILKNKHLTLLNPQKWDDKNDSGVLDMYAKKISKEQNKEMLIRALCFTKVEDSVLHWNIPQAECRIRFDLAMLEDSLKVLNKNHYQYGRVKYWGINELSQSMRKEEIAIEDWPFIKRWPYRAEEEYRIIWEGKANKKETDSVDIPINLECIKEITISQRVPENLFETLKEIIIDITRSVDKKIDVDANSSIVNDETRIHHSNLTESKKFLGIFN